MSARPELTETEKYENQKALKKNGKRVRTSAQKQHQSLYAGWQRLPDHPTKPAFDQLEEWEHSSVCGICGKTKLENGKALALDHNHATGEFRGFLCELHNLMLGYAEDKVSILDAAKAYINDPPARSFI